MSCQKCVISETNFGNEAQILGYFEKSSQESDPLHESLMELESSKIHGDNMGKNSGFIHDFSENLSKETTLKNKKSPEFQRNSMIRVKYVDQGTSPMAMAKNEKFGELEGSNGALEPSFQEPKPDILGSSGLKTQDPTQGHFIYETVKPIPHPQGGEVGMNHP